jgi:bacteriocin-like protein
MTQDYAVLSLPELTDKELAAVLGGNVAGAAALSRAVGLGNAADLGRSAVSAYGGAGVTTFAGVNLAPVVTRLTNTVGADVGLDLAIAVRPTANTNALVQIG